jgi:hypothetical protein
MKINLEINVNVPDTVTPEQVAEVLNDLIDVHELQSSIEMILAEG